MCVRASSVRRVRWIEIVAIFGFKSRSGYLKQAVRRGWSCALSKHLMQEGQFSKTARRVAIRRAAHQLLDDPRVLDDPLALAIIGSEAEAALRSDPKELHGFSRGFRAFMAARSRFAEDELAHAVAQGVLPG